MSEFPSHLRLNNIPLYVYTTLYSFFNPLINTWLCSTLWLLWIILLWTWVYKYIFEILLSFVLGTYPEAELLNYVVILFSLAAVPFYITTNNAQFLISPHPCQHWFSDFFYSSCSNGYEVVYFLGWFIIMPCYNGLFASWFSVNIQ